MDRNESQLVQFLIERIEKSGGSAQLNYLSHNLNNVSYEVRNKVASTQSELMKFLRKHNELFHVDASANVRLQNRPSETNEDRDEIREAPESADNNLPQKISDGEGIVIKILPQFGFIAAKSPFKTTVYFTPVCFGDGSKTLLSDFEALHIGSKVRFHANRGTGDRSSKYRAVRVWFAVTERDKKENINDCRPNPRKSRETGLYDPVINEGEGRVIRLFPNYGFIAVDDDPNNTVFFNKVHVANFDNVVDLTKALKVGDLVEFKANRAGKKNIKARWCATHVWVRKSLKSKTVPAVSEKPDKNSGPPNRQYIQDIKGKIFPHSKGTVVKFGDNFEKLADADSSIFYLLGSKVSDVSWEFSDGDSVRFDAVQIKSHPGWKATLVWTGDKPNVVLPPDMGDFSEFAEEEVPDSRNHYTKLSNYSAAPENHKSFTNREGKSSGYSSLKASREEIFPRRPNSRNSSSGKYSNLDMDVEDISDTTSCYSRSSDISANRRGRGKRRRNYLRRRENNFDKKNPSFVEKLYSSTYQQTRHVDYSKKSSMQERRQMDNNKKSSTDEWRSRDNIRNTSVDRRKVQDKERFQRHLDIVNNYIVKSGDEGEGDNFSVKSDPSDNLSVKSDCSKTESSFLESTYKENNTFTNWADTPYPGEEDDEDFSPSKDEDLSLSKDEDLSFSKDEDLSFSKDETSEKLKELFDYAKLDSSENSGLNDTSEKLKHNLDYPNSSDDSIEDFTVEINGTNYENEADNEVYDSGDEFNETVQSLYSDSGREETSNSSDLYAQAIDLKPVAKVKIFQAIEGKITKVYCKYAEISNSELPRPASFFWNDVYQNGKSISNNYDDLKEFMKVGDEFKFNCIEVIDDDGNSKLKCTLVWLGKKPNIVEMTPEQYIAENKLSVTLGKNSYDYYCKEDKSSRKKLPEASNSLRSAEPDPPVSKFLVALEKVRDESEVEESASSRVVTEVDQNHANEHLEELAVGGPTDTISDSDKNQLIDGISKIIKYSGLPLNLQADLDAVSSQVLHFVINSPHAKKCFSPVDRTDTQTQTELDQTAPPENVKLVKSDAVFTNTESQTIFTGEVIGKSTITVMMNLTIQKTV